MAGMERAFIIREAVPADAQAIARVNVDTWRTAYTGLVPADFLADLSYEHSEQLWYDRLVEAGQTGTFAYVGENAAGQIVGFAIGGPEREGDPNYRGELYGLYILEEYQRQGLGRRLVSTVAERLVKQGLDSMLIWVLADNQARGFYETLGGQSLYQKYITVGRARLLEVAYGWQDISRLAADLSD
jgi:ribosomal protein S18 acetylase RimI-like enzyme